MPTNTANSQLQSIFGSTTDPLIARTRRHDLLDILFIALAAILSGSEDFVTIAEYGGIEQVWLKGLLGLPNGIPSHDTVRDRRRANYEAHVQQMFDWDLDVARVAPSQVFGSRRRTCWLLWFLECSFQVGKNLLELGQFVPTLHALLRRL